MGYENTDNCSADLKLDFQCHSKLKETIKLATLYAGSAFCFPDPPPCTDWRGRCPRTCPGRCRTAGSTCSPCPSRSPSGTAAPARGPPRRRDPGRSPRSRTGGPEVGKRGLEQIVARMLPSTPSSTGVGKRGIGAVSGLVGNVFTHLASLCTYV